ncbi:MAG TPA: D-aminoacyl-tRNA deacylase [Smithella sp.]|jgi:D-tyrosyl-tRNA(Tyr) deacylase|nr:D-tyrosyl-tRNA(Tyr) deacylase [Smithella sp.]OQC51270.1 MAG: D-tyrosyl-tRNA(Tyr) deacylase [Deltaproteobacteria bacterium ADurb.Bin022]HNQ65502.1 D-aminoacyl-tRNA deacylase [Smithella sp.]HOE32395.1 D-aminoacyl-tRNA deacylase [Smithella sp.]HOG10673.1 D-aminoacyl-tRNA deacylase [Smithella sp.]
MRAVIQRVDRACVSINRQVFSSINEGILILLGVEKSDTEADADYILEKAVNLRIFEDDQDKMNLSLLDTQGDMMVVSQFTLLGNCVKGRRPSFDAAEEPVQACRLYDYFVRQAKTFIPGLATGKFQEMMKIDLVNDGPVTIILDSRKMF